MSAKREAVVTLRKTITDRRIGHRADVEAHADGMMAALNAAGMIVVRAEDVRYIRKHWWTRDREQEGVSGEVQDRLIAALADQSGDDE